MATLTLGEFRKITGDLPDDVEILVTQEHPEFCSSVHPEIDLDTMDGKDVVVLTPNDDVLELDVPDESDEDG